jgi:3-carboxy-cis,cis-muconate cycloisomerase
VSELLWPGDDRAGNLMSDDALLAAMVQVEQAWLTALVRSGIAPKVAGHGLHGLVSTADLPALAAAAEDGGNPVIPLVTMLRDRLPDPEAARWLHRGLTSQDVLDTALMRLARDAVAAIRSSLRAQVVALAELATVHRDTPMVARTLTQHAVPTTFGLKVAGWLTGILDAYDDLGAVRLPVQLGGAAGTLAALVELGDIASARACVGAATRQLGLAESPPWHTTRTPVTRLGDAAVRCTDAWGRVANDVLTLGRPEVGELAEGRVGGGSSTMPHKANPVLSTLLRRAALAAPQLGATLHLASAGQVDERADGAWHAEWETLALLLRRTVVAGAQATDLVSGLRVRTDRMRATLDAAGIDVLAEQRSMAGLADRPPRDGYRGLDTELDDAAVRRAHTVRNGTT